MNKKDLLKKWDKLNGQSERIKIHHQCIPEFSIGFSENFNLCAHLKINNKQTNLRHERHEEKNISFIFDNNVKIIVVELLDVFFKDIFLDLIISLFNTIKDEKDDQKVVDNFTFCIFKWRSFFTKTNGNLSENDIKGLLGELFILKNIISRNKLEINDAIKSWRGPYGDPQDFQYDTNLIEVKSKLSSEESVKISSIQQLSPEGQNLILAVVNLNKSADGKDLSMMINDLREIVISKNGDISELYKSLRKAGVEINELQKYEYLRFNFLLEEFYNASSPEFPSLRTDNVPKEIKKVRYTLLLSNLKAYRIPEFY
ncbi:PD-(D/E)XK motif protein [Flammeovirga sp. SubArs3]|uniref:PD-(D/E)XK motif protein n=1 Tax=Flammeovirga sp. SubArs3 TaxID=2995316 RepID=UPI00248B23E4|nr:PD-(D/E)XK motif protein [Flammeovirga sp. SubArs3]